MRLLLTGGGTGGHVYPMIAVLPFARARALALASPEATRDAFAARYIGGRASIEQRLATRAGIEFEGISVGGVRGLDPLTQARNFLRMFGAFGFARRAIKSFRPDAILATGGYVSAAVVLAGAFEKIPILIYLPDLEPGLAIKNLARWATRIGVSFPEVVGFFNARKTVVTGYPVRAEFFNVARAEACAHFKLNSAETVVTVFGGSRGAQSINRAVEKNLAVLLARTQVIHLTGDNSDFVRAQAQRAQLDVGQRARYFVAPYLDEAMPSAMGAADVIVARAGAATLGELPAAGVPGVLVPYPYAGQHQDKNAEFLVARGAALKLEDARLDAELATTVINLLEAPDRLATMKENMKKLSAPDAAEKIANLMFEIATH